MPHIQPCSMMVPTRPFRVNAAHLMYAPLVAGPGATVALNNTLANVTVVLRDSQRNVNTELCGNVSLEVNPMFPLPENDTKWDYTHAGSGVVDASGASRKPEDTLWRLVAPLKHCGDVAVKRWNSELGRPVEFAKRLLVARYHNAEGVAQRGTDRRLNSDFARNTLCQTRSDDGLRLFFVRPRRLRGAVLGAAPLADLPPPGGRGPGPAPVQPDGAVQLLQHHLD